MADVDQMTDMVQTQTSGDSKAVAYQRRCSTAVVDLRLDSKIFHTKVLHRILRHMPRVLNVDEKKN